MTQQSFSLKPFPRSPVWSKVTIVGTVARSSNQLTLHYLLRGDLASILIPPPAETPMRQDDLWKTTCFEFFLAPQSAKSYWEFNLSPAGHWNVYRFTDYRQGMQPEAAITQLPFTVQQASDQLQIDLAFDLGTIVPATQALDLGITTVIQDKNLNITYLALAHPSLLPNFHNRKGFSLRL